MNWMFSFIAAVISFEAVAGVTFMNGGIYRSVPNDEGLGGEVSLYFLSEDPDRGHRYKAFVPNLRVSLGWSKRVRYLELGTVLNSPLWGLGMVIGGGFSHLAQENKADSDSCRCKKLGGQITLTPLFKLAPIFPYVRYRTNDQRKEFGLYIKVPIYFSAQGNWVG